MSQTLSSKENSLFRQVVKCYESKQFKKGLKAAEQILRKSPNHGETQAMKALVMNAQGQSEEAFALAKIALKNAMKSHVCWHVYGLLYRSAKNYEEAIKAYKFALRIEPESANILRDLALLQIQMRDYQGYIQSRKLMLKSRPGTRQNWTALAVAHHLAGELEEAEKILTTYENTLKTPPSKTDVEHSEAVLYKNTVIAEAGNLEGALEHLDTIGKSNLDQTAVMEYRAQYLLQLGKLEEAQEAYRALLDRNSEYRAYYDGLEKALGLDKKNEESVEALATLYNSYAEKNDRLDAARRIPLDFLKGEKFRQAADTYLRQMLNKGVPSTFANIKALYQDEEKKSIIEGLVKGYDANIGSTTDEGQANGDTSDRFEQSVLFFLAQHYNYHRSRDLKKAMEYIERAIEKNPKSVDYSMTKARIWKHHGNTQKASEVMNHARQLDEKDRYINSKSAKYQLRDSQNDEALKTMSKFTRNETAGGPLGDLHDMQCMWYITEDGEAHMRQEHYGLALKRFGAIYDIFDIWQEDQFDFHSFSLRKGQIRAYVDMVRWEDHLREHPFYARAAISAVKIYTLLADKPHLAHGSLANGTGVDLDSMDPNERKKLLKKAKKEQEKKERAEAEKREAERKAAKKPATGADGEPKKEDPDPNGTKLVQTEQPLEDAMKFLGPLLEFGPKNIEAQNVGFEVYLRRKKYLLALKCLLAAHAIDPENATLHQQIIRFRKALNNLEEPLPSQAKAVIDETFKPLIKSESLEADNDEFLSKHRESPLHIQSFLKVRQLLDSSKQALNEKDLLATLGLKDASLHVAYDGLILLKEWKSEKSVREEYIASAKKRWPDATIF